jgi:hypothetical protein
MRAVHWRSARRPLYGFCVTQAANKDLSFSLRLLDKHSAVYCALLFTIIAPARRVAKRPLCVQTPAHKDGLLFYKSHFCTLPSKLLSPELNLCGQCSLNRLNSDKQILIQMRVFAVGFYFGHGSYHSARSNLLPFGEGNFKL